MSVMADAGEGEDARLLAYYEIVQKIIRNVPQNLLQVHLQLRLRHCSFRKLYSANAVMKFKVEPDRNSVWFSF